MRKSHKAAVLAGMLVVVFLLGCTEKKPVAAVVEDTDSLQTDTTAIDTLEELITEQPIPTAADELFDDFIFNFAGNRRQQMRRIQFPLRVTTDGRESRVQKNQWKIDHFFMEQGYYTLIFDSRRQMELPKDTSVSRAVVEKIDLQRGYVRQYHFDRLKGLWMLTGINQHAMEHNDNASFLQFYQHFATDSAFQMRSLCDVVAFTGPNPDDDFEELQGDITPEQWPAFAPGDLPEGVIYNIVYGQPAAGGNQKIFLLRGISNGLEMEMTFRRVGGEWKLASLVE